MEYYLQELAPIAKTKLLPIIVVRVRRAQVDILMERKCVVTSCAPSASLVGTVKLRNLDPSAKNVGLPKIVKGRMQFDQQLPKKKDNW